MAVISMKQFLAAGVHFGHQTKRWHPNMAPYIYGIKNGVHVIDLRQTLTKLKEAYEYVKASAEEGRVPLFVGTKIQIQRIVKEEADRCGCPYINFRWLGGLLTNFGTVKQSIARMKTFEEVAGEDGSYEGVIKKEALMMERKRVKLERSLGGVRNMKSVPSMLFITDCHKEQLALKEAQKLGIPVVGIADTNCDPTGIDFVIPGNDDSPRAVALYANVIATAVMEGLAARKQTRIESITEEKAAAKKTKPAAKAKDKETDVVSEAKAEEEKKTKVKAKETKAEETPSKIKEVKTEAAPGPKPAETKVAAEKAKPEVEAKPEAKVKETKAEVVTKAKSAVKKTPAKKTAATAKKAETASGEKVPVAKATKAKKSETKK